MRVTTCVVLTCAMVGCSSVAQAALMLQSGFDASAETLAYVRARQFSSANGAEMYLQVTGNSQLSKDFYRGSDVTGATPYGSWKLAQETNSFSLTYDGANTLTWQVGASHNYQLVDANFDPAKPLNYLQFDVVAREAGASVEFKNINLNGESLGDLASLNGAGWKNWYLGSAGLDDGFTLTGDLVLSGVFSTSQENNKLQVTMGHTAQVVPEPSSLAIFGSGALGLGLVALLRRRRVRG